MYFRIWKITIYQFWLLFLSLTLYSYFSLNPRSFTSVGVWYQEFSSMIRSVHWIRNSPELQMAKRMLMEISSLRCVFFTPFSYFCSIQQLFDTAPLARWQPVHVTQFFDTFFFHAVRNAFWKGGWRWREEESANCLALWFKFCVS